MREGFWGGIAARPYQLLCLLCQLGGWRLGEGVAPVTKLAAAIRQRPDVPITVQCNAGDVYAYQNPGPAEDTPGSVEFNRKRDLDILEALDLAPGSTLPARTLLMRVHSRIPTVRGICGYEDVTAEAWQGCPAWDSGAYERGRAAGLAALIPPRPAEELLREKRASVQAMEEAGELAIRPHVMMCAVCHFGNTAGQGEPLANDNIVEFIALVRARPDIPVRLAVGADWMVCAPCPVRVPESNACVNVAGSGGLSNEKRDLDMLKALGLTYGCVLPARELYLLLFERVPSTMAICRRDSAAPSVWWDPCGERNRSEGNPGYERGRTMLLQEWGVC